MTNLVFVAINVITSPFFLVGLLSILGYTLVSLFDFSLLESISSGVWAVIIFATGLLSGFLAFRKKGPSNLSTPPNVKTFSNLRFRQSSCPPAFPNGWYKLCNSDDIQRGQVKYFQACGQHIALFRGKNSGRISALDAFCPHLGANMAIGGHVKDDCLVCPFHEWTFNGEGDCVNVPYFDGDLPPQSKAPCFIVEERYSMVMFWFDAEGRDPLWQLPKLEGLEGTEGRLCVMRGKLDAVDINMHIQDFQENGVDYAHFPVLHQEMMIPWTQIKVPFIKIHHEPSFEFDPNEPFAAYFKNQATLKIFGKLVQRTSAHATVNFLGSGGVVPLEFEVKDMGRIVLFECHTPTDIMQIKTDFVWFAEPHIPKFLVSYVVGNWHSQWANDIMIWENKVYRKPPVILKTDGPVMKFRRWYQKNYSENSEKVSRAASALDW